MNPPCPFQGPANGRFSPSPTLTLGSPQGLRSSNKRQALKIPNVASCGAVWCGSCGEEYSRLGIGGLLTLYYPNCRNRHTGRPWPSAEVIQGNTEIPAAANLPSAF
ncbi:hypothetical protein PoB_000683000 [Plakobranchus ocellatus]|uniref:LITAF domain-containing protein n=1 Tax=Plakobranchus ocellatus TaxID=259542 RepID=A0AAV3YC39_9GAST|nr:hypothetical protein PoB_000683000 [Plakobranchus ocellatus]